MSDNRLVDRLPEEVDQLSIENQRLTDVIDGLKSTLEAWGKLAQVVGEFFGRVGSEGFAPSLAADKLQAAMEDRLQVVPLTDGLASVFFRMAEKLRGTKGVTVLTEALELHCFTFQDEPRNYVRLAGVYMRLDEKEKAIVAFLKALKGYVKLGFYLKATSTARRILQIEPKQLAVYRILFNLYTQLGLSSEAQEAKQDIEACMGILTELVRRDATVKVLGERTAEEILRELFPSHFEKD